MTEMIHEAMTRGVRMHMAGEFDLARQLYGSVIKLQPNHADANHNMGVLTVGVGTFQEGLPFFKTALEANPSNPNFWLSYIDALVQLERLVDAKAVFDQAKERGAEGDAFDQLEQRLSSLNGANTTAAPISQELGQEQCNILDTLKLDQAIRLAMKKSKEGSLEDAKRIYQDVLVKFPKDKRANDGLKVLSGNVTSKATKVQEPPQHQLQSLINLYTGGELQKALDGVDQLLQKFPNSILLFNIQGASNAGLGQLDAAIDAYNKVLALKPDYANAHNNMGTALKDQGKLEEAIEAYNKALALKPDHIDAYNNLGNALKDQGKLEEAIEAYKQALAIKPDYAEAHYNMGVVLQERGELDAAIDSYKRALKIKPDYAEAHYNMSFALLNIGRLTEGLDEYEWRWKTAKNLSKKRCFSQPFWGGNELLKGQRILLWGEQGPQDITIWSSCLPYLSSQVEHCIVECPKKLVPLLARSFPNVEVKATNRSLDNHRDDFDFHLPMGSLFRHFIPEISKNFKPDAFLLPDPSRVNFWKKRLNSLGSGPYVGVSWKSPLMEPARLPNYTQVSDWAPVLALPDVTFINLQSSEFRDDLATIQDEFGVTVHNFEDLDHYDNLDDVAALSAALDIVVSVSTAVSAIAAGVGTSTKLVAWRQSSWNNLLLAPRGPSVDVFERNTWEPWDEVFNDIAKDIAKYQDAECST
jgi:tetratricopeptide (TPR) repeat protein